MVVDLSPVSSSALERRSDAVKELQERVEAARRERDHAHKACSAGIQAARSQIVRMRAELSVAQSSQAHSRSRERFSSHSGPHEDSTASQGGAEASERSAGSTGKDPAELDEERAKRQALQQEARCLRLELTKWRHKAATLECDRSGQDEELARLQGELTHSQDVLESTRSVARHHQLEVQGATVLYPQPGEQDSWPLGAGNSKQFGYTKAAVIVAESTSGRGEAAAERNAREKVERRNDELAGKVRRLEKVFGAQQQLIERLEKELLKEESVLEQKDMQLQGEARRKHNLKSVLRRCSDDMIAAALGVVPEPPKHSKMQPVRGQLSSVASLPQIDGPASR